MLSPEQMEKARLVQLGMQQFESQHMAVETSDDNGNKVIICPQCTTDFPCERMLQFMLIQSLAALQAMIPSGNMGAILGRFGKS